MKDSRELSQLQQAISSKKEALADHVEQPLAALADRCAEAWPDADAIDKLLQEAYTEIPYAHLLFVLNIDGIQISSNVEKNNADLTWRGLDQSKRPYLMKNLPYRGVMLSSLYMSLRTHKQCITVLHSINIDEQLLGFICADFSIADLPAPAQQTKQDFHWTQFKGDPAVRSTVFMQKRVHSLLDEHIDEVLDLIEILMVEHGVFHTKIHFSSGRISMWLLDDPFSYRIYTTDELINPDICLAFPQYPYREDAKIPAAKIKETLEQFRELRFADETIYLRSSSINLMNGILGLTFSCDGSHYMPYDEFLERDLAFWLGNNVTTETPTT
ncbi:MAG: PDC sensor domain-containing protein [Sulfuriflexus sp.]|nr:PDC sensor domain-containing protein [Sulfuriflexus sp.]